MRRYHLRNLQNIQRTIINPSHSSKNRKASFWSGKRRFSSSARKRSQHDDLFRYTSGRWLWDEDKQSRLRYRRFDPEALMRVAADNTGRGRCVSMTKIAEGGFNRVFRLVMEDGHKVVARVPYPCVTQVSRTIMSEVATMKFASTILEIPVPRVITWDAGSDNSVGAEYIIMEEAPGIQLGQVWRDMDLTSKLRVIDDIVDIQKKLLSISFTWYGNLYLKENAFPGCVKAEVIDDVPQRLEIERRFVVGPIVDRDLPYRDCPGMAGIHGPWQSAEGYLLSIAKRQVEWLDQCATARSPRADSLLKPAQGSAATSKELLERYTKIVPFLIPEESHLSHAKLWHWDLHASNLFVKDNKVVGVIDWQDTWTGPLFLEARHPRLVQYNEPLMLEFPKEYKTLPEGEEKSSLSRKVENSLVLLAYESETETTNPGLHQLFQLPHGRTRIELVDQVKDAWDGDIMPLRQSLIRITQNWHEIKPGFPCPIDFTPEELAEHYQGAEAWNDRADFWDSIKEYVQQDGWTSNETYEQAREIFAQLRENGLNGLTGDERDEFEKVTRWARREEGR